MVKGQKKKRKPGEELRGIALSTVDKDNITL